MSEVGSGAIEGRDYTLTCGVSGDEMLGGDHSYKWTSGENSQVLGTNMAFTFQPTLEDDGEMYHCEVTVSSSLLISPIHGSNSKTISVLGEFYQQPML